jgi:hypothetical protein
LVSQSLRFHKFSTCAAYVEVERLADPIAPVCEILRRWGAVYKLNPVDP